MKRDRFVTPNGVTIASYDFGGDGPDLILAHATGFHGLVWQPVIERLTDDFRCIAFDERGHGDSGKAPGDDYDWRGFATDVLAVVDGLSLRRPLAVGHSCGGALLLLAEQRRPGTFGSLYCYEPVIPTADVPLGPAPVEAPIIEGARRRREVFDSKQEAFENYSAKAMFARCRPEAMWAYVDHGFEDQPDGTVRLKCRSEDEARVYSMGMSHDAFENLHRVHCPVTLACGSLSGEPFDPATQRRLGAPLPRARTEVLAGLTHLGPLEDPALVAERIRVAFMPG